VVRVSVFVGVLSWASAVCGSWYVRSIYKDAKRQPLAIFEPGAFEEVLLVLVCAMATVVGFIIGASSKSKNEKEKRLKIFGLIINAMLFIPVGLMMLM
jgi:hypothetical protein